jgi:hypothetical protein
LLDVHRDPALVHEFGLKGICSWKMGKENAMIAGIRTQASDHAEGHQE